MKYSEKRIENFTIFENKINLAVHYKKTAKDWFDAIAILVFVFLWQLIF